MHRDISQPRDAGGFEFGRGVFGLSSARVLTLNKAFREGTLNEADYDAFLAKITGNDLQRDYEKQVGGHAAEIAGDYQMSDGDPFSIGLRQSLPGAFEGGLRDVVKSTNVRGLTRANLAKGENLVELVEGDPKTIMVSPEYKAAKKDGGGVAALRRCGSSSSGSRPRK